MNNVTRTDSPQPNVFATGGAFELPMRFWFLTILTGLGAGLGGGGLMLLLRAVQHLAWSYWSGEFLDGVQRTTYLHRILIVSLAGFLVFASRFAFKYARTAAAGEVSEAIWFKAGRLPFFSTVARAVLSIVLVGLGASVGREGAPKQVGAALASALADFVKINNPQRRLLVACGVGAGIAAVYNVPFGGALFALEVLLGTLALPMVAPALLASLIGTAAAWLVIPNQPTYQSPHFGVSAEIFLGAAALGVICGLLGALWVWLVAFADSHKPEGVAIALAPIVVFVALGCLAAPFPQLLGNGKDIVQLTLLDQAGTPLLVALLLLKPLATVACLGSGTPGGLFTPTISLGAIAGAIFGLAWTRVWPGPPPSLFALVGAAGFLAAASKGPVSSTVLMLELTRRIDPVMAPLMLAVAGATLVARFLDARSIYSARIHRSRDAAGPMRPRTFPQAHTPGDQPTVMSAASPYAAILKRLLTHPDAPIYVVDEKGKLIGEITSERATVAEKFASPLEVAVAYDLAEPVAPIVQSTDDPKDIDHKMRARAARHAPVVAHNGAFVGVAKSAEKQDP